MVSREGGLEGETRCCLAGPQRETERVERASDA